MRVKWRAIWLVCWTLFLVADVFLNLRTQLSTLIAGAEQERPDVFHSRLQTGLLVLFVLVALAPILWSLVQRWFLQKSPKQATTPIARDERDFSVAEALSYLAHQSAWGAGRDATEDEVLRDAAAVFEDAARKGRIKVRGVPPGGTSRELITPDYWLSAGIDLAATIETSGRGGQTSARAGKSGRRTPDYDSLVVDRRDLMKLWPPDNVWRRTGRATARGVAQTLRFGHRDPGKE